MSDDWFAAFFLLVYIPLAALAFFFLLIFALSITWQKPLSATKKAVLISGCDSGIGLRLAVHLYSQGFHVFAACLSTQSQGHQTLGDKRKYCSERMIRIQLDTTSRSSIEVATNAVADKLKELELTGMQFRAKQSVMFRDYESRDNGSTKFLYFYLYNRTVGLDQQCWNLHLRGIRLADRGPDV